MFNRRALMAGAAAGALCFATPFDRARAAAPAPPSLDEFFDERGTVDAALSPDGKQVALLRHEISADVVLSFLEIVDAANPTVIKTRIAVGAHKARVVVWGKDQRILIWLVVHAKDGDSIATLTRVISVRPDGSQPVPLLAARNAEMSLIRDLGDVIDWLPDDPDHVLMNAFDINALRPTLWKVDVNTGKGQVVEHGAAQTIYWWTQNGLPMMRLDAVNDGAFVRVMARGPQEKDWKFVRKIASQLFEDFFIAGPAGRPGVFVVGAQLDGEDTVAIRELDLQTLAYGPPIWSKPGHDATGALMDSRRTYMGAVYVDDRVTYELADKTLTPHFNGVQKFMGPEVSLHVIDVDSTRMRFLFRSEGGRDPGTVVLYDREAHRITALGLTHPRLPPEKLATVEVVRSRSRDGIELSGYLTAPASGLPGPLVVMPHGGPELRDRLGWNFDAQVLATQGWWVLQPNFRGSGGYGLAFAKAGWGRWGDRMQEDLEDMTASVIVSHKLDGKRVAIMGSSYGGYAALMGAVRRPELYKAAISIAGVSDLVEQMKWERVHDDTPDDIFYTFWRQRIGDPEKDVVRLRLASPHLRATEIRCPVLLIHGDADSVVPVQQSRMMERALKAAGKTVDYWEMQLAGHGGWSEARDRSRLERCIDFLTTAFA